MASVDVLGISDETMLIYIYVVFVGVCQAFNIFGMVTNIINMVCFVRQGFKDQANISLFGLAVADFGCLTTMALLCAFLTPAMMTADIPIEPMDFAYLLAGMSNYSFTRVSSCFTALITLERCLCITFPLKIKTLITTTRAIVITVSTFLIFFFTSLPVYFVNKLEMRFSAQRNQSRIGLVSTPDHVHVDTISFAINNFSIPCMAFGIIVICTIVLSFKLNSRTQWRQLTTTGSQGDKISNRNKKAAKMVVMISTLFIVSFIPVNINVLAMAFLPDLSINGSYVNVSIMICGLGYVMESINSSMNIFIYYRMSSNYRDSFCAIFVRK